MVFAKIINPMEQICLASANRNVGKLKRSEAPVQEEGGPSEELALEVEREAPTREKRRTIC